MPDECGLSDGVVFWGILLGTLVPIGWSWGMWVLTVVTTLQVQKSALAYYVGKALFQGLFMRSGERLCVEKGNAPKDSSQCRKSLLSAKSRMPVYASVPPPPKGEYVE